MQKLAKKEEFYNVIKMSRTQMQDAVPIRLGAEFGAYSQAISRDIARLERALEEMYSINLGGTAVGTALNTNPEYVFKLDMTEKEADELLDPATMV